jgi:hypothetical protein
MVVGRSARSLNRSIDASSSREGTNLEDRDLQPRKAGPDRHPLQEVEVHVGRRGVNGKAEEPRPSGSTPVIIWRGLPVRQGRDDLGHGIPHAPKDPSGDHFGEDRVGLELGLVPRHERWRGGGRGWRGRCRCWRGAAPPAEEPVGRRPRRGCDWWLQQRGRNEWSCCSSLREAVADACTCCRCPYPLWLRRLM